MCIDSGEAGRVGAHAESCAALCCALLRLIAQYMAHADALASCPPIRLADQELPPEGHVFMFQPKVDLMVQYARDPRVRTVCEIGFNVGHSALIWLANNARVRVVAFDMCSSACVRHMAAYLNAAYGDRLELHCGDSVSSVREYASEAAHAGMCDVLLVDGGHEGDVPLHDLRNFRVLARRERHVLLMDDVACEAAFCEAPATAYSALEASGELVNEHCVSVQGNGLCSARYVY